LCLVDDDGPAAGVVVNHATGDTFTAVRGGGARRNDDVCRPSGVTEMSKAIVGVSGLPTHHYGWAQFRAMGASAPDICSVACGVTDAWCDVQRKKFLHFRFRFIAKAVPDSSVRLDLILKKTRHLRWIQVTNPGTADPPA
jgi:fructose-1,6-bisphosphatase/inositol monophosphatase family enzyme